MQKSFSRRVNVSTENPCLIATTNFSYAYPIIYVVFEILQNAKEKNAEGQEDGDKAGELLLQVPLSHIKEMSEDKSDDYSNEASKLAALNRKVLELFGEDISEEERCVKGPIL